MRTQHTPFYSTLVDDQVFALLESLPDAAFIIGLNGLLLNANTLFAERFSKLPQACIGTNIHDLIAIELHKPETANHWQKKSEEVVFTGQRTIFEDEYDDRFWKITINPILSSEKEIVQLFVIIQDISEQKHFEKQSRQAFALHTTLLETIPGFAIIINSDGHLIGWNHYTRDIIFGKTEDEMHSVDPFSFICPDNKASVKTKFLFTLRSGCEKSAEIKIIPQHGEHTLWLLIHAKQIIIDGKPCVVAVGINITERKRIEHELIESKQRFSYALDAARSGIWEWNVKTDELTWSDQVWALYGLKVNSVELNHNLCVNTVHPDDREMTNQMVHEALTKKISASIEYRVSHPDGSVHWLISRSMPLRDTDGHVTRYVGTIIDITQRKQIEIDLNESKTRFNQALKAAAAGVWEWNLISGETIWSDEIWTLCGLERNNEKPSFELWMTTIHPDDRETIMLTVSEATNNENDFDIEYRVCHPDGSIHWQMSRGNPLRDAHGQLTCYIGTAIDITDRKNTEIALIESKAKLNQALEAARAGIWEWNLETNENIWSDEIWPLFGLTTSHEKPSFQLWTNTIHPDDREMAIQTVTAAAKNATELHVEYRVCLPDGSVHWLMSRGKPLSNDNNKTVCYIGTAIDITERKKIENELIESKKRFTFALEATNAGIWEWDVSADKVSWSAQIWKLYGLKPNSRKPSHKLCASTVHPDDLDITFQKVMVAASKETDINIEYRVCHKDGSIHWLTCHGTPLRDADGRMSCYIGTVMDITERKKTEILLKESELKFRSVFDYSPVAIGIGIGIGIGIENSQDAQLLNVNDSWLKLFGYTRAEIMEQQISDIELYVDIEEREKMICMLNEHGRIINRPLKLQKKSGDVISVLYSAEYITLKDKPHLLVMMTDITLQELQQENIGKLESIVTDRTLQLKKEVERLHRFLSMISHEYRTPLAILRVNLDLIELKNISGIHDNQKEINKMQRAIDRLVEVMDVSIQESRIIESQKTDALMYVTIAPLITSQVKAFLSLWPEYTILYSEHLDNCKIIGDSAQLKLAIFNLLDNARKYSLPNSPIEVDCQVNTNEVVIRIRNEGKSITQEEGEKFFEKYQRGNNAINTGGAGLGLWLVRNIINRHNGQVTLTGIPSGVEAKVCLPLVKKEC